MPAIARYIKIIRLITDKTLQTIGLMAYRPIGYAKRSLYCGDG